jgi:hypothetical protein
MFVATSVRPSPRDEPPTIDVVQAERRDAVIAGVNKAGTTSLFVSLSEHPDVAPSAVKETRFFLPARYGEPVGPIEEYDAYFEGADGTVRLEATPSLFYGGDAVAAVLDEMLTDPRVIVVLREPVRRTISFFEYQKTRLRVPAEMRIEDYLAHADALPPDAFSDPENERWFAVGGSRYADFLPAWIDRFGDRLLVLAFEDVTDDPAAALMRTIGWLGLDPSRLPADALSSENRTMAYKSKGFQRAALGFNDRFERVLRRYPGVKRRLRALYFRVNGRAAGSEISDAVRADLAAGFREPNERLYQLLSSAGLSVPPWLAASRSVGTA